jgi:hypothetical protein
MGWFAHRLAGLAVACLVALPACKPKIAQFDVSPLRACRGDTVAIGFKVRGTPSLLVTRRGDSLPDTTTYTIVARRRGKEAYARKDVITMPTQAARQLSFDVKTVAHDSLYATETLSPDVWKGTVRVRGLSSLSARPIEVRHGGKAAVVAAGSPPSEAFSGLTVDGPWELAAPIVSGEVVGGNHPPPTRLRLLVALGCDLADSAS